MTHKGSLNRRQLLGMVGAGLGAIALRGLAPGSRAASATGVSALAPIAVPVGLETMIGQMLMLGFQGFSLRPETAIHSGIASGRVGNVVLFDYDVSTGTYERNVESPSQLGRLTRDIQYVSPGLQLISADQEGGYVTRLKPRAGFPATLSAEELGALHDPAQTRSHASEMASSLRQAGINLNLAPVVDVNVNPDNPIIGGIERSFSSDPEEVARQALAFIEGHHDQGVLTTLKHFPGHGSSEADSHLGFVDVTHTWSESELIPFQRVIESGHADAVMTAHIFNENLDPEFPATLSERTITGVLREQLGFEGVIVTDDMMMGAISNYYSFDAAVEAAVLAGADVIAIANNSLVHDRSVGDLAFDAILNAVLEGRISEARIEQSYNRIQQLKSRLV